MAREIRKITHLPLVIRFIPLPFLKKIDSLAKPKGLGEASIIPRSPFFLSPYNAFMRKRNLHHTKNGKVININLVQAHLRYEEW